eukprot:CAMPEP_0175126716 /NCGR_PEP_ID=MMETSP0087-20121206/4007_1 /TAXON_ID=136419 /ORGANISM="Unknown Unknown, Strain D1" /LENGTH=266 /DNA_ID=CAMNT_0016408657 /DNA_START=181 /DNA_END=981 /DNA_ORIENTATION=+
MPAFDTPNQATLFDQGIVSPTVNISLTTRQLYSWAASVPKSVFFDAVLPYSSVNEARTNWRVLLWDRLKPLADEMPVGSTLEEVATVLNSKIWTELAAFSGSQKIVFKGDQTPLVYDTMSTLLFGYASCTGVSILYVNALRAVGVPARLAGTPAWNGNVSNGNHNWVEVWLGEANNANNQSEASLSGWHFLEGAPAGGGESFSNPCDKWFCTKSKFSGSGPSETKVFAAAFKKSSKTYYPMAWDLDNHDIPGVDRSTDYQKMCGSC